MLNTQPEEFPRRHLFVQEQQKPRARKIGGLVSDQTDGGEGVFAVVMQYKLGGTGQQERSGALLTPSVLAMYGNP